MLSANPLKLLFVFRSKYAVSFSVSFFPFSDQRLFVAHVSPAVVCFALFAKVLYTNIWMQGSTHKHTQRHTYTHKYTCIYSIACGVCRCQASKQLSSCVSNSCLLLCDTTQHVRVCCCVTLCVCECVVRYFIKCTRCVTALPIGSFAASQLRREWEREKELQLGTAFWLNALARPRKMILINVALSVLRIANV